MGDGGIEILKSDPADWAVSFGIWRRFANGTDQNMFLHRCMLDTLGWELDQQCAGFFNESAITVTPDFQERSLDFCYDFLCGPQPNKTRCEDPKFSRNNNRRWRMRFFMEQR